MFRWLVAVTLFVLPAAASASSLDRTRIKDIVSAEGPAFRQCWEAALARNAKVQSGRVVTSFKVERAGAVSAARTTENETGDEILAACTRGVFMRARFDEMPEPVTINYPLVFASAQ